jgi:transposase InsO family protein
VPRGWQKPERRDPHCPWQNGKMERFDRTLQTEWAYRQVFTTDTDRTHALAP